MMETESSQPKGVNRRTIIKGALTLPLVCAAATIGQREIEMNREGFFTHDGVKYQSMYEVHSDGPKTEIDDKTSALFVELNTDIKHYDAAQKLTQWTQYDAPLESLILNGFASEGRQAMLEKAKKLQIPIGIGDVGDIDWSFYKGKNRDVLIGDDNAKQFYGGVALAAISAVPEAARILIGDKQATPLSRRDFLTFSIAAAGTALGTWLATDTKYFDKLTIAKAVNQQPINRFLTRLHGMATNLHPDDPFLFTRNVIMCLKIKQMAAQAKQANQNPIVAFNLGAGHSGIEDLICLPDNALREVASYINNEYINKFSDKYGANIATTRLIQADDKGKFHDLPPLVNNTLLEILH